MIDINITEREMVAVYAILFALKKDDNKIFYQPSFDAIRAELESFIDKIEVALPDILRLKALEQE
jgi:hypothetical protein